MDAIKKIGKLLASKVIMEGSKPPKSKMSLLNRLSGLDYEIVEKDVPKHAQAPAKDRSNLSVFSKVDDQYVVIGRPETVMVDAPMREVARRISEDDGFDTVVVYPGRFQPFHSGHRAVYEHLVGKFGRDKVFIATSDKTEEPRSPFGFEQKREIITSLSGVPKDHLVQVKSPYSPEEITGQFDPDTTALVVALSEKDKGRLGASGSGGYYETWNGEAKLGYEDGGYVYHTPMLGADVSGTAVSATEIRKAFRNTEIAKSQKRAFFEHVYGGFDEDVFSMFMDVLSVNESLIESFIVKGGLDRSLNEASTSGTAPVDDSPSNYHSTHQQYQNASERHAKRLGYEVVSYLDSRVDQDFEQALNLATMFGTKRNYKGTTDPEGHWKAYIDNVVSHTGYELIDYMFERGRAGVINESLITEGGGFGHMAHPFEDLDLTFKDLKQMVKMAHEGNLDVEGQAVEKVDGQNLMVSWVDGELRAARNKGNLKNFGEDSMDLDALVKKFEGRGELLEAFEFAFEDLSVALSRLDKAKLQQIFEGGKNWMSLEIVYPPSKNLLDYGSNFVVFHGTVEVDEDGNTLQFDKNPAYKLGELVRDVSAEAQENFKILSPPEVEIPALDMKDLRQEMIKKIDNYKSEYNLSDSDKIMEWHESWWESFIKEKAEEFRYDVPSHVVVGLVRRWAWGNKSGADGYSVNDMKRDVEDDEFLAWAREFDKQNYKDQFKANVQPIEEVFLRLGTEVMKKIETLLAVNPEDTARKMQDEIRSARAQIEGSASPEKLAKLRKQMEKVEKAGGIEGIATEGVVFQFDDKVYKLTGSWAPLNQLVGMIKYGR